MEKMQRKSIKALRKALVSVTCQEHNILYGFLSSNLSKIRLKIVNVQTVPPRFEKMELWTNFNHDRKRAFTRTSSEITCSTLVGQVA
jgi:hypothetical protein